MKKYIIPILSAIILVLRILSINKYLNIILGFILLMQSIMGFAILFSKKLNKQLIQTIPMSVITITLNLIIFGILNLLFPGLIITFIVSFGLFNYYCYKGYKPDKQGLLFFFGIMLFMLVANYFMVFNIWDEFSFWSNYSKNVYFSNSLNFDKYNFMVYDPNDLCYPPNPTVFYYYIMKLFGNYRHGFELFGAQLFGFSLLLPLFKYSKNKLHSVIISVILLCIPTIFIDGYFYYTIYVDCILGLLTAYALMEYNNNKEVKYRNLVFALALTMLAFTKNSGFIFSFILIEFYIIKEFLNNFSKKTLKGAILASKKVFKNKFVYIFLACMIVPMVAWHFYKSNISVVNAYKPLYEEKAEPRSPIKNVINALTGAIVGYNYNDYSQSLANFPKNILDKDYYSLKPFKMGVGSWLIIFSIIMLLLHTKKRNYKNEFIAVIISAISYIAIIQLTYLTMFSSDEAILHNSAQRYIGSILLALFIYLLSKALKNFNSDKSMVLIMLVVLLFTPMSVLFDGTIFSGHRNWTYRGYNYKEREIGTYINENIKEKDKIMTINQKPNNFVMKIKNFAAPNFVENSMIIKKDFFDEINYFEKLEEYKYILVVEMDRYLNNLIEDKYNQRLESWTLYEFKDNKFEKLFTKKE